MKILHIAAHMGAGAGKAISGLALSDDLNQHKVILLEKPEKIEHLERCQQMGIEVIVCPIKEQMIHEVSDADVVILNWWHHPLTYQFLVEISNIPSRIILWSHVNGLIYPKLKSDVIRCFDVCMFTSKVSFQNRDWSEEEKEFIDKNAKLVYGMGDFEPRNFKSKKEYNLTQNVLVGYVGTLDYAKLHPDFVIWLKEVVNYNSNVKFMIAGDSSSELFEDVRKAGISKNVEFLGFRKDIPELLCEWDIFIYPLNPMNFATTENALLEAMAAGLPIIASDGIVEQSIIEDGKNGFLVSNEKLFVGRMKELLQNKELRRNLGQSARQDVIGTYDKKWNCSRFLSVIDTVSMCLKKEHDFVSIMGKEAFRWFLVGCGNEEVKLLEEISQYKQDTDEWKNVATKVAKLDHIYKGESKGSIKQFSRYYPEDKELSTLIKIMEEV